MSSSPEPSANTPFTVPAGYRLLDSNSVLDDDQFDWDTINNNPNLELWLVRMPNNISAKYLESATLPPPSSLRSSKSGRLRCKETTYDIWSHSPFQSNANEDEAFQQHMRGEEMKSITCLLPRRLKGGGLYTAPRPITRHVVVATESSRLQPVPNLDSSAGASVTFYQNPPRQSYPPDLLRHRFIPYGSLASVDGKEQDHKNQGSGTSEFQVKSKLSDKGDKDEQEELKSLMKAPMLADSAPHLVSLSASGDSQSSKSKKRKGDRDVNEGVKKSKKLKTKNT